MKRFILGLIVAISLPVMAAVLWPSGAYLETFQNGFIFGTGKVLSVLNDVITFDGNRLDDRSKDIIFQEDFKGASVSFACDTDFTATNGTNTKVFTQGATPPAVNAKCAGPTVTLETEHQSKNIIEACFNTTYDGNDNEVAINIAKASSGQAQLLIPASSTAKKHCVQFSTNSDATFDYDIEVLTPNANKILEVFSIEVIVDPLTPTDIYASSEWESFTPVFSNFGATGSTGFWRRVGDNMEINAGFTSCTPTASLGSLEIPAGYQIDASKLFINSTNTQESNVVGKGETSQTGTSVRTLALASPASDLTRVFFSAQDGSAANKLVPIGASSMCATGAAMRFDISIPIAGWSNTAQGVVVKNRTDSASVENVFSAKISSTGVVSDPNIENWYDGVTKPATGLYNIDVTGMGNSSPMNCQSAVGNTGTFGFIADCDIDNANTTNTTIVVRCHGDGGVGAANDLDFILNCQKATPDYIKETDKVYTVPVTNLVENVFSARIGSLGTVTSESVDFIEGDCTNPTTGRITCTLKSGFFTTAPHVSVTTSNTSTADIGASLLSTPTTTTLDFSIRNYDNTGSGVNSGIEIIVQRQGTDYIEPKGVYLGTFGQPTCYVKDVKASGAAGGDAGASTVQIRDLNTTEGNCSFLSLSSNQMTIEAGEYNVNCAAQAQLVERNKLFFYNVSDTVNSIIGYAGWAIGTANNNTTSHLSGKVSINSSKIFELRHYTETAVANSGLGQATSDGTNEIYGRCEITKVR